MAWDRGRNHCDVRATVSLRKLASRCPVGMFLDAVFFTLCSVRPVTACERYYSLVSV